jgi:ribosome-associated translation inhibitor RaiA/cold shock CspA family protein
MQLPLQITFRHMETSEAVEAEIRKWVAKLEKVSWDLISCRVVVEAPQAHKQKGGHFHTRIDLTLPGREIVVNREPPAHQSHEDAYVSIRDAFENARRLLSEEVRRRQGEVKVHAVQLHGRIAAILPKEDYGSIETPDGRELVFHRNSVLNADFDGLKAGDEVRFEEQNGGEELRASSVRLVGKHHLE